MLISFAPLFIRKGLWSNLPDMREDDLPVGSAYCNEVVALAETEGAETFRISASVEAELVGLVEEECADY